MQVPVFVKDLAERAVKTAAGGFITGAGLSAVNAGSVALSSIDWQTGLDVAAGTTLLSLVFSLASFKFGDTGTASAVKLDAP